MMHAQSFLGILLILIGLFPILAVRYKWKSRRSDAEFFKRLLGEDVMDVTKHKTSFILFGLFCIVAGVFIIFRIIGPEVENTGKNRVVQKEISEEELINELGLKREFYYGIKALANEDNQYLIRRALEMMEGKAPEFFKLVADNVKEIRQSKGPFPMGPVKSVGGTERVEFSNFAGQYSEYNVAVFLVHEATHIVDQGKGLPYTKGAEIRAREAEIHFLRTLGKVEGHDFESFIKFVENEIEMIKKGRLYHELP